MRARFERLLSDKNDKFAFLLAFFGGVAAIVTIRLIGDSLGLQSRGIGFFDILAIFVAVGVIIVYIAYIMSTKNRSGISVDRASDNVYYLGLLFTLVSLAYSLIKLSRIIFLEDAEKSGYVLTLLPDFGLALFSTIFGILGRILLQQMRNDPMDVETIAREELGDSIRKLRETIGQVISNLNGLSEQTKLSLTELNQTVSKTLEQSASQTTEAIRGIASEIGVLNSKIQEQVTEVTNSTVRLNEIFKNIHAQFEGLSKISNITKDAENKLNNTLSDIGNHVESLNSTSETIGKHGKKIEASVKSIDDVNNEYIEELNKAVETLRSKTDRE